MRSLCHHCRRCTSGTGWRPKNAQADTDCKFATLQISFFSLFVVLPYAVFNHDTQTVQVSYELFIVALSSVKEQWRFNYCSQRMMISTEIGAKHSALRARCNNKVH